MRIHPIGKIQVHFGPFGSGLVLSGAIQAIHAQQFLTSIQLKVTHDQTREQLMLRWRILYPDPFNTLTDGNHRKELPAGIMVNPQQAYRFTAFFANPDVEVETITLINGALQSHWSDLLGSLLTELIGSAGTRVEETLIQGQIDGLRKRIQTGLVESEAYSWAKRTLESAFSWNPGSYSLRITVSTAEPDNSFSYDSGFELSPTCVERLRRNIEPALGELSGMPHRAYEGCTVDYTSKWATNSDRE